MSFQVMVPVVSDVLRIVGREVYGGFGRRTAVTAAATTGWASSSVVVIHSATIVVPVYALCGRSQYPSRRPRLFELHSCLPVLPT